MRTAAVVFVFLFPAFFSGTLFADYILRVGDALGGTNVNALAGTTARIGIFLSSNATIGPELMVSSYDVPIDVGLGDGFDGQGINPQLSNLTLDASLAGAGPVLFGSTNFEITNPPAGSAAFPFDKLGGNFGTATLLPNVEIKLFDVVMDIDAGTNPGEMFNVSVVQTALNALQIENIEGPGTISGTPVTGTITVTAIPEPTAFSLALGFACVGFVYGRRRNATRHAVTGN